MICGWLLPPLAVLIRFGVGLDFVINLFCTIAGYIPGHVHNFWIQNIRNNKNARHSPSWAIRYGLVKDYRAKRSGWSDRYGESGGNDFNNQDIIVDPVTGETRKDPDAFKRGNVRAGSHFLSPWADNMDDSPRAEREDPYADERRPSERQGGRVERDPVTGAILSGNGPNSPSRDSLSRSSSRRSLGNRYAERYGLGGGQDSSTNTSSYSHDNNHTSSSSSKWSRSKPKKKDRWAREAEALGTAPNHPSYGSDSYSFDNDNYNTSSNNRHRNTSGSIRDPLSDRHDF